MRKTKLTILLLAFLCGTVNAQTATIDNVLKMRSTKSSGEIISNKKLVGYYVFYFKEKVDKKNSAYEIQTFDDNYNPVKSFEITRPKNTMFVEMVFNGSVFMFHFYDRKTGFEFVTYNPNGEKQGEYIMAGKDLTSSDVARINQAYQAQTDVNFIYSVGSEGFMRSTFSKNKKIGYELIKFDNNAKKVWSVESPVDSKEIETIDIADVNENITVGSITRRSSIFSKSYDVFGVLINTNNGKIIKEIAMGSDEKGRRSMLKSFISDAKNTVTIIGEFYKPKDDMMKDRSAGLYLQEFSLEGDLISDKQYKWKGNFDKFKQTNLSEEDKKDDKRPFYIFFHDVIQSKNGNIVLVGEQYIKQISAGAIAGKALAGALGGSSNASSFEILVGNMVVIEFDDKKDLTGYDIVQKKKTHVFLPEGYGMVNSLALGQIVKAYGNFDYYFTSSDYENDKHDIVYIDADRKEEKGAKKSDKMIGVISVRNGKVETSRTPLNCESNFFWIQPAKPGYISVGEYDKKAKSIDLRLETISY
jgi:hypothetical protein